MDDVLGEVDIYANEYLYYFGAYEAVYSIPYYLNVLAYDIEVNGYYVGDDIQYLISMTDYIPLTEMNSGIETALEGVGSGMQMAAEILDDVIDDMDDDPNLRVVGDFINEYVDAIQDINLEVVVGTN